MNKIKMLGIGAVIVTAIGAVCTAISKKGYAEGFRDGAEDANDDFDMEILSELGEMNYKYRNLCRNYDELSSELKQANSDYDALLADYEEMLIERETAKFYESISDSDTDDSE